MDLKYLKNVAVYIVTAVISVFVIAYIAIQLTRGFGSAVETTAAIYVTERELITIDAYIIRSERVLYSKTGGSVSYLFTNGSKVGVGTKVASVYSGGDIREQIIAIDSKIDLLEKSELPEGAAASDLSSIDAKINELFTVIRKKAEDGNLSYVLRKKDELLTLLNKRQIIIKTVANFDDKVTELQKRKSALLSANAGAAEAEQITTDISGYFYNTIDGYETAFSAVDVGTMTISEYQNLIRAQPYDTSAPNQNGYPIGKIADSYVWYAACEIDAYDRQNFIVGKKYNIIYPYSGDKEISSTLYRVITEPGSDTAVLVFKNGIINDSFNFLRRQTVEIVQSSYGGYRVPITAVRIMRDEDGVLRKGVFILSGSVVKFREIKPLFEKNGYLIVEAKDPTDSSQDRRLALNEMIITKGKDYYDGQVIG